MSVEKLHPDVEAFKKFMNERPALVLEMRKSGETLQECYEKWYLHGAEGLVWNESQKEQATSSINYSELLTRILKYTEQIDINKAQHHIKQFNKIIDTIQTMLNGFNNESLENLPSRQHKQLFNLFRD